MTDLPTFLLARIAEDQAAADELMTKLNGAQPDEAGLSWWGEYAHLSVSPVRVAAECESKRQLVDAHWDGEPDPDFPHLLLADCPDCWQIQPCHTLRRLALPYADHPDFRPEWAS